MGVSLRGRDLLSSADLSLAETECVLDRADRLKAEFRSGNDPRTALRGADAVYTDTWVSMGQEAERGDRLAAFVGFQLNDALLEAAPPHAVVMHCLPAHRGEEITDGVLDGDRSVAFEQAENRLHVQKALLAEVLAGG